VQPPQNARARRTAEESPRRAALRADCMARSLTSSTAVLAHRTCGNTKPLQSPCIIRMKYAATDSAKSEVATARKTSRPTVAAGTRNDAPPAAPSAGPAPTSCHGCTLTVCRNSQATATNMIATTSNSGAAI
jgi:hypothetical protein